MLAGCLVVLYGPLRPSLLTFVALGLTALLALGAWVVDRVLRSAPASRRGWVAGFAIVGGIGSVMALCTLVMALDQLARRWSSADEGSRVIAEVVVESLTRRSGRTLEFDAALRIDAPAPLARDLRARVSWHDAPSTAPRAGERWRLLLRLDTPRRNTNPGGFDEQREFFRDRLQARAVVISSTSNRRLAAQQPSLLALRERIAGRIRDSVVDRDAAALFAGLAVGATGAVSREQWRTFSATGTTHLVAISGMHVTLFCWLVAALARASWRRMPWFAAVIDRDVFAASLGVSAALGYALLAGFGVPTQRTVVMLAVWWGLRLGGRVHGAFDALGLALIAVLVIDPFAPLSSGFWLSFVAMATLIVLGESQSKGVRGWILDNLRTQWWVGLALLPFTLLWFSSIPVAGLLVNLVAIPVFSFVLVPVALLGSALGGFAASAARPLWWLGERVHDWLWPLLVAVAAQPLAVIELDLRGRLANLVAGSPRHGEVMVTVLDAGDGAAIILRTRNHALVYGTGEQYGSEGRAAEHLVLPALQAFGVDKIDLLMLGSSHAQHAAGAGRLQAAIPVVDLAGGGEWPGARRPLAHCAQTRRWRWDGVDFASFGVAGGSCVLRVAFEAGPALLIPERIDLAEATALAARATTGDMPLASTLVVAPRRGSLDAVSRDFIDRVDPQWVLLTGRDPSRARQLRVAGHWRVDPQRLVAIAARGAVTVHLRAGLPPRWLSHADLQGAPLWRYHPGR